MKRLIIIVTIIISILLIFAISVYIGANIEIPETEQLPSEQDIVSTKQDEKVENQVEINEIEPAISEEQVNNEHYVLKEIGKYIKVYSIDNNGKEEQYMSTDIATEYLPETDKESLKEGIHVYSKGELNEILQDFE